MSLTVTDLFAGAGGSSTGMIAVPGVKIRMAANHWKLAIAVHNTNHPNTDHADSDLHEEDPRYFPRTDVLWASPECTKWSQAGASRPRPAIEEGLFEDPLSDEAATRSRLLMFDVLRFAEHHRYRAMIVENVVEIATREKYRLAWREWQRQLTNLGYEYRVVSLNSMHAQALGPPAPQSRDRLYVVCWRKGDRAPDVNRFMRPRAWCPRCDRVVESRQAFKPGKTVGKYRDQYVYVHDVCGTVVEPGWLPAAAAIDWSIPGTRIGDRPLKDFYDKQGNFLGRGRLAPKTIARIAAGIARYWRPFMLDRRFEYRTRDLDLVMSTLTANDTSKALLVPVEGRDGKTAQLAGLPSRTQTARSETGLVTPLHLSMMGSGDTHVANSARPVDQELRTLTAEGNNDYLLAPYYGTAETARPVTDPIGTLTTHDRYALVMRNNDGGAEMSTPVHEVLRTLTTRGHQSIITPGDMAAAEAQVDDCLFRMFAHHEVAAGMAFPRNYRWDVLDEKGKPPSNRNLVKMAGNAVTPPSSRDLMAPVVEALTGEDVYAGMGMAA